MRKYLDLTHSLLQNNATGDKVGTLATTDDISLFINVLGISDQVLNFFKLSNTFSGFLSVCPIVLEYMDKYVAKDAYFAVKNGFILERTPSYLVYMLIQAERKYKTPNRSLSNINRNNLQQFLKPDSLFPDNGIERIMSNIFKYNVTLLTKFKPIVPISKNRYEVYAPNIDAVLVIPEDMAKMFRSVQDTEKITYKKSVGILYEDKVLRTFNGRLGITTDDLDLTGYNDGR